MYQRNNTASENKDNCKTSVSIDVTKIVKYSCISSVLIVLIVFAANVMKSMKNND